MAIRQIRLINDPILRKKSREVKVVNDRIKELLDDMIETMSENNGVGLAAPQVGILRRVIVVDDGNGPIKLINPEIIKKSDEEVLDSEGCLSVPNRAGEVLRPEKLVVKYIDEGNNEKEVEAEGLLARILCHEIDHLNGVLFVDIMEEELEVEAE